MFLFLLLPPSHQCVVWEKQTFYFISVRLIYLCGNKKNFLGFSQRRHGGKKYVKNRKISKQSYRSLDENTTRRFVPPKADVCVVSARLEIITFVRNEKRSTTTGGTSRYVRVRPKIYTRWTRHARLSLLRNRRGPVDVIFISNGSPPEENTEQKFAALITFIHGLAVLKSWLRGGKK